MISKAFQDIVSQMSDVFPKKFGIVDSTGLVLASNGPELSEELAKEFTWNKLKGDSIYLNAEQLI